MNILSENAVNSNCGIFYQPLSVVFLKRVPFLIINNTKQPVECNFYRLFCVAKLLLN